MTGIVQGVGFRPFVWRLASELRLSGWVLNDGSGVLIEIEGETHALADFERRVSADAPPLARVESVSGEDIVPAGDVGFSIMESRGGPAETLVSPDVAVCPACVREMFDTGDRRFLYPFINCTDCGPRYTIIEALPYDRPLTTMAGFEMCTDCRREYENPADRRFHAQPVACPACGPHVWLAAPDGKQMQVSDPVAEAAHLLEQGRILAIKGLGGFHLAVDASNEAAVARLRTRKHREEKPLALMARDLDTICRLVHVTPEIAALLASTAAPIVLAARRPDAPVASSVAPGQKRFGVMLPYTPLHHLLMRQSPTILVMTSGNLSEEPIAHTNEHALASLSGIADAFLLHNRDIHIRIDDSVVAADDAGIRILRRSRGYAPAPVRLSLNLPEVLALGPQLKNTIAYIRGDRAFMSHHIGDLENAAAVGALRQAVRHIGGLYGFRPKAVACDLHPDYASTAEAERIRRELGVPLFRIQHHHAHAVAALAEKSLPGPALAVVWDGTGYGDDGAIWGAEWLLVTPSRYRRVAHLEYTPVVGGDAAVRNPAHTAFLHVLHHLGGKPARSVARCMGLTVDKTAVLAAALHQGMTVPVGSMGRLFDAVSALCGVRLIATYEGQAAIELEAAADPAETASYPIDFESSAMPWTVREKTLLSAVLADLEKRVPVAAISAKFHRSLVNLIVDVVARSRDALSEDEWPRSPQGRGFVILSGGAFQNTLLTKWARELLAAAGFEPLLQKDFPPNDGCVSLGQAVAAAHMLMEGRVP